MKKLSYQYVKEFFSENGYKLLSTEYIDNHQYLDVICPNNHEWKVQFYAFKHGNRCKFCCQHSPTDKNKALEIIKEKGFKIISGEYVNSKSKLLVECRNGHRTTKTLPKIKNHGCSLCSPNHILTYSYVKEQIEKENYTLLSNEYISNNKKLDIQCDKGHIYKATYNTFQSGCRCPICSP